MRMCWRREDQESQGPRVTRSRGPKVPGSQGPKYLKLTFKYELDSKEGPSCLVLNWQYISYYLIYLIYLIYILFKISQLMFSNDSLSYINSRQPLLTGLLINYQKFNNILTPNSSVALVKIFYGSSLWRLIEST